MAIKSMATSDVSNVFRCDHCGNTEFWNETRFDWRWYGSEIDADNGIEIHLCSDECQSAFVDVEKEMKKRRKRDFA